MFKFALSLLFGLLMATSAQAQTGSINQLFAFTCFEDNNNDKCPQGLRQQFLWWGPGHGRIDSFKGNLFRFVPGKRQFTVSAPVRKHISCTALLNISRCGFGRASTRGRDCGI